MGGNRIMKEVYLDIQQVQVILIMHLCLIFRQWDF